MAASSVLPQEYEKAKEMLLRDVEAAKNLCEIRKLFQSFSFKMTMIPDLWQKWMELERITIFPDFDNKKLVFHINNIRQKAAKHFCHKDFLFALDYIPEKFHRNIDWPFKYIMLKLWTQMSDCLSEKTLKRTLSFPHPHLRSFFGAYRMFATRTLSSDLVKMRDENNRLYLKIKNKDITEYSYALKDIEFAIENIEWELAKKPTSKEFWSFYLQFLKVKSPGTILLNVYSRYCRLFFNDVDKREEYYEEIKACGSDVCVEKWWIDLIEIERNFGTVKKTFELLKDGENVKGVSESEQFMEYSIWFRKNFVFGCSNILARLKTKIFGVTISTNFVRDTLEEPVKLWQINPKESAMQKSISKDLPLTQDFSLPYFIMEYLYINTTLNTKTKLQKTCKQIFLNKKQIFCHRLEIFQKTRYKPPQFVKNSLHLCWKDVERKIWLKKLNITYSLKIGNNQSDICSKLLKIVNCNLEYLYLHSQALTVTELNQLSSTKLESIYFVNLKVHNLENVEIPIEELIVSFPQCHEIRIKHNLITENTAFKLATIPEHTYLRCFSIGPVPPTFDTEAFASFLNKHASPCAKFGFFMAPNVPLQHRRNFQKIVRKKIGYNYVTFVDTTFYQIPVPQLIPDYPEHGWNYG